MTKTVVVVSSYVDNTIKEMQRDVTFHILRTLEELDKYIETRPIRAQTLFISRDAIPLVNTSLSFLVSLLGVVFFKVDNVVYVTEPGSPEIESIKFLVTSRGFDNWEIIQGALTREYMTGVVTGTARNDLTSVRRKAVYRIPKDEYIRSKSRHSDLLEEERYKDDDESIQEMPDEKLPIFIPPDKDLVCQCYDIVGDDIEERTLFIYIMGQYLATHGKTLLLERDWKYHRLGEYVTKSGVDCGIFYVDDLFSEPQNVLDRIIHDPHKLIVVLNKRRLEYSYSFIFNLLYNNLYNYLAYVVREDSYGEEPTESPYTVVFPNTMCGILEMCDAVNMNFLKHTKFVAIHTHTLNELRVPTREAVSAVIEDVLNETDIRPVELLSIGSLTMGVDSDYDLRSVLWM